MRGNIDRRSNGRTRDEREKDILPVKLRKPCEHGRYEEHSQYRRHFECDGWTWTEKVFTCLGGAEASTVDLLAALEARGFVERFPQEAKDALTDQVGNCEAR